MKKLALALLMGFVLAPSAFAYTMIKDPNVFYSIFEKPKKLIEFTKLKDGTTFDKIPVSYKPHQFYASNPDCLIIGTGDGNGAGGFEAIAVRPNAFSSTWSFKGADPTKPNSFCDAVIWFDQGISAGNYKMTVSAPAGQSQPFVLYTEDGFLGILPDSPQETHFVLDHIHILYSFETEFSKVAPASESEGSYWAQLKFEMTSPCPSRTRVTYRRGLD
ncbi:MAG: hypothetical protein JSW39_03770 [Desulfobacterales bacterium]|nr:MAG: hypothetical protein JSW39_03770 [Desulfobacterales bacterium]